MAQWDTDLQKFFPNIGFDALKEDQTKVLDSVVKNGNTLGIIQTGGGKSLIYWMAALEMKGTAIVISPLISLIDEQTDKLKKQGYDVLELHGGIDPLKQMKAIRAFANKELNPNFIFLSPEKIAIDGLLEQAIKRRKDDIKLLVIDEVHCVSQWGMSFRPFYQRIPIFMNTIFGNSDNWCRILALTATVNNQELKDICSYFHIDKKNIVRQPLMMRSEIQLHTKKCMKEADKEEQFWNIINIHRDEKILVYVYRKYTNHGVEGLCEEAEKRGYKCAAFHGDMTAKERQEIIDRYKKNEINIVFATNAFGMGIDIPDIRVVIHYMIPESGEQYYQEIGRAARDGKPANAYMLYTDKNIDVKGDYFIDNSFPSEDLLHQSFDKILPFNKQPGYKSLDVFDDDEILKCLPYFIEAGLVEIVGKCFGDMSVLEKIQSPVLQEYANEAKIFLRVVKKKNIKPNELATLVFNEYLDGRVEVKKALNKTLVLNVLSSEISDEQMKIMNESIDVKKAYKHDLLDYFVYQVEQCRNSQELHQEIAYYLGTDKHQLNRIHEAKDGTMVRSKSEIIICNLLVEAGIKYVYEEKLFYDDTHHIEPDFTIELPNGKKIYWEHVGMLGLNSYDENWARKLDIYEKHFPGQMIKTYESGALSKDAESKIEYIKQQIQKQVVNKDKKNGSKNGQTHWDSKYNNTPFISYSEADVIALVNKALSGNAARTSTYKFAFFKSILDNVFNVDLDTMFLSYDSIAMRFTEIYWNLVLKYHLKQMCAVTSGKITSVEHELFDFCDKYKFEYSDKNSIFPYESLLPNLQLEITKKIRSQMMKYVVGAFCGDTEDQFYHFNKTDNSEGINLNHDVYLALVKYKSVFEKQNYYEWIKYLEKANLEEDTYALANKLDAATERQNLAGYRDVLIEFNQTKCFYCGRLLKEASDKASPVDHFIPWSFVKDDKLWNFVLACPRCNSSKSNILPDKGYFTAIKERNNRLCNMDLAIVKQDFKSYSYSKLEEMWHSAVFNGFESGWRYGDYTHI